MLQTISITSRPKVFKDIIWRRDGENEQIIILHSKRLALPQILNPTAASIFSLCNSKNSIEDITAQLCAEFAVDDFSAVLEDVKNCLIDLVDKKVIEI